MRFFPALPLACAVLLAQAPPQPPKPVEWVCPMDPEVRAASPGKCPRCGMTLVPGIPAPEEFPMDFRVDPPQIPAGRPVTLEFRVTNPKTGEPVSHYQIVHEKLFHLFLVSQDLAYFAHLHPVFDGRSTFRLETVLPKPGTYELLADFYPTGGTPQLAPRLFTTAGYEKPIAAGFAHLQPDLKPQKAENLTASLRLDPPQPIPGKKTLLFVHLDPADGLEPYIGAWAHMLAVSADLIDKLHEHPVFANGGPDMQFNLFFPRAGMYKVWIQFQRKGVVNTVAFVIPVPELK